MENEKEHPYSTNRSPFLSKRLVPVMANGRSAQLRLLQAKPGIWCHISSRRNNVPEEVLTRADIFGGSSSVSCIPGRVRGYTCFVAQKMSCGSPLTAPIGSSRDASVNFLSMDFDRAVSPGHDAWHILPPGGPRHPASRERLFARWFSHTATFSQCSIGTPPIFKIWLRLAFFGKGQPYRKQIFVATNLVWLWSDDYDGYGVPLQWYERRYVSPKACNTRTFCFNQNIAVRVQSDGEWTAGGKDWRWDCSL